MGLAADLRRHVSRGSVHGAIAAQDVTDAAEEIERLSADRDAVIEECAKLVEATQETITEGVSGSLRYLTPRKNGNLLGLAFADGIRALKSSPSGV